MALQNSDLFFVNRNAATYKIEAHEIGDFLLTEPKPDGSGEHWVGDAALIFKQDSKEYEVTNANAERTGYVTFDDNFELTGSDSDVHVSIDFIALKDNWLCNDSGFADNNCGCLQIDWPYLTDKILCNESGLKDEVGCISVNICDDSPIYQPDSTGCLDINVCAKAGVINSNGCLSVDNTWILDAIPCQGGGLTTGQGCLAVDPIWVKANMNIGKILAGDNIQITPSHGDLAQGDVTISSNKRVDWSNIDNKPNHFPANTIDWGQIQNKPTCFNTCTPCNPPTTIDWNNITGRPNLCHAPCASANCIPGQNPFSNTDGTNRETLNRVLFLLISRKDYRPVMGATIQEYNSLIQSIWAIFDSPDLTADYDVTDEELSSILTEAILPKYGIYKTLQI